MNCNSGFFGCGGNSICWILILILLFCSCGNGTMLTSGSGCGCGCGCERNSCDNHSCGGCC